MSQYETMFSSNKDWESIPKCSFLTQDQLSIEGWLLGKMFDKFIMHVPKE